MKQWFSILFFLISLACSAQRRRVPAQIANDPERIKALLLIVASDTMQQSVHWPNITPKEFLDNLKRNIRYPLKISTGRSTNFCGYGAVTYTCLKNEPLRYAECMLSLYRNGEAYYRNIKLAPSETIKKQAGLMEYQGELDIRPADQVWFLSLAHRFKGYLNLFDRRYSRGDENTLWAATNLAKFNRMLRKLCKYKVGSVGSDLIRPRKKINPELLKEKLTAGEVYLYLNNALLRKKNHNRMQKRIPTHYIVLTEINSEDGHIVLKYWDGSYKTLKEVSLSALKQIVYGISWVKYREKNDE
jgi:hypothetical protein